MQNSRYLLVQYEKEFQGDKIQYLPHCKDYVTTLFRSKLSTNPVPDCYQRCLKFATHKTADYGEMLLVGI